MLVLTNEFNCSISLYACIYSSFVNLIMTLFEPPTDYSVVIIVSSTAVCEVFSGFKFCGGLYFVFVVGGSKTDKFVVF